MICYVSRYAGFCFGVSLAVNAAYENARNGTCMLGEIVHNPLVIRDLESRGIRRVENADEIGRGETVLIRAHGVGEDVIHKLNAMSVPIIDRTCPKVKRIHDIVKRASEKGERIIIAGNARHPEVIGIVGWCDRSTVVESEADAKAVLNDPAYRQGKVCLVSQTTFNRQKYGVICDILVKGGLNVAYHDTICLDTSNRQREVNAYAAKVDCVIVVGGKNSSNSTKLYEIAKALCKKALHVESAMDIDTAEILEYDAVFVTGGASTPRENVMLAVEKLQGGCAARGCAP